MLFIDEIWEWLITLETEQALALAVLAMIGIAAWAITNPNVSLSLNKQARDSEQNEVSEGDVNESMVGAISSMASSIHTLATEVSAAVKAIATSTKQMNDTLPKAIQEAMRTGVTEAVDNMAEKHDEKQQRIETSLGTVLEILTGLVATVNELKTDVSDIKTRLNTVESQLGKLESKYDKLSESARWPEVIAALSQLQHDIDSAQQEQHKKKTDELPTLPTPETKLGGKPATDVGSSGDDDKKQ